MTFGKYSSDPKSVTDIWSRTQQSLLALSVILLMSVHSTPCQAGQTKALLKAQEAGAAVVRGLYDRAVTLYDEALAEQDLNPARRASLYNDRGVAKWRLQKHREAIVDFNEAVKTLRDYAPAFNNRGNVLLELGFIDEAIKDFDRAILLTTGYGSAYNNRANAFQKLGQYDKALLDYGKAAQLMPTSPVPLNGRGKAHLAAKRYHAAIRDFTRATILDPKYLSSFINRAQALIGTKEYDTAIRDLSFAIVNRPDEARLYTARGKVQKLRGKLRPAAKDFDKAISLNEKDVEAYTKRGAINITSGEYEKAIEDLNIALEINPSKTSAHIERALALYSIGSHEEAITDVQKAIELEPTQARAHFVLAQIMETLGKGRDAIEAYRTASDLDPERKTDAHLALERLTGDSPKTSVEKIGKALNGWEIVREQSGRFVATNARYASVEIPLEMYGEESEQPQLLEWSSLKKNFKGIGLLRYYAGKTPEPESAPIENIAVVDLKKNKVASIEPFKWGGRRSKWDWKDGAVVVTDHHGASNKVHLRKPKTAPRNDWGNDTLALQGASGWVYRNGEWVKKRRYVKKKKKVRKKHKKSFFELLFN